MMRRLATLTLLVVVSGCSVASSKHHEDGVREVSAGFSIFGSLLVVVPMVAMGIVFVIGAIAMFVSVIVDQWGDFWRSSVGRKLKLSAGATGMSLLALLFAGVGMYVLVYGLLGPLQTRAFVDGEDRVRIEERGLLRTSVSQVDADEIDFVRYRYVGGSSESGPIALVYLHETSGDEPRIFFGQPCPARHLADSLAGELGVQVRGDNVASPDWLPDMSSQGAVVGWVRCGPKQFAGPAALRTIALGVGAVALISWVARKLTGFPSPLDILRSFRE